MGAGPDKEQFVLMNLIYEKPVGRDVAFAMMLPVSRKGVVPQYLREASLDSQGAQSWLPVSLDPYPGGGRA